MARREDENLQSVVVDVEDQLFISMNRKLSVFEGRELQEEKDSCTIYRVLPTVRNEDPASYEPKIISIGPFHRDKEHLKPMEILKWRFLHDLIRRSPENSLDKYIKIARILEPNVRRCYSEPVEPADIDAFVEMMVLDGCFIVEFLIRFILGSHKGSLYFVNWNLPLVRNDILLLENQIPFFILQSFFDISVAPELCTILEGYDRIPVTLVELALCYVTFGKMNDARIPHTIHHLLHLFHSSLSPPLQPPNHYNYKPSRSRAISVMKKSKHIVSYSSMWLLSAVLYCRRPPQGEQSSRAPRRISSATKLREAGIKFSKKENSRGLLDVSFSDGDMKLPLLSVQAATIPQFRNLVAFEQCCPAAAGSHFTSYVALMDNLIDTPEDVVLLQRCGVIESKLGGSEEVAAFFNSLGKGGYLDYDNHYLAGLFREVREFSVVESNRWRAMLVHDYFSNPWAIISLVAGIVLLSLTAVQTFFAIFSYLRPS